MSPLTLGCWAHLVKIVSLWWSKVCLARTTERNGCTLQVLGSTPHTPTIFSMSAPTPQTPECWAHLARIVSWRWSIACEALAAERNGRALQVAGSTPHTPPGFSMSPPPNPRVLSPLHEDRFLVMVNSLRGARNRTQWVHPSGFRKHTAHTNHIFHERPHPPNPRVLSPLSKDCLLEMVNSLRGARSRTQWSRPAGCREHTAHATRIFHELPRELNPLSKDRFLVMVNSLRDQHNAADAPFLSYRTLLTPLPFPSNACTSSSFCTLAISWCLSFLFQAAGLWYNSNVCFGSILYMGTSRKRGRVSAS